MEQKTNINPNILQEMLASAANAAEKGQSQFFTPLDFGRFCAQALPKTRPTIVDLTCGNGQLLHASVPTTTKDSQPTTLLGSDIDPTRNADGVYVKRIHYDLTLLYPLLKEIQFSADCFVLNPPWRLFWHRDRLKDLAESRCPAVRESWTAVEENTPRDTIDSTIATLMVALDLCTSYGEGLLIANNNTLDRLLFNEDAPFKILSKHIWARVVIPGNPMTGLENCKWMDKGYLSPGRPEGRAELPLRQLTPEGASNASVSESDNNPTIQQSNNPVFSTGVIYFARTHLVGPRHYNYPEIPDRTYRQGSEVTSDWHLQKETVEVWDTAQERVTELQGKQSFFPYNIWLDDLGRIRTHLSRFEDRSTKTDKEEASRLYNLTGKAPMELVIQRNQRDELFHVAGIDKGSGSCGGSGASRWKVCPKLIEAIQLAVQQYHSARAPLYPLPEIQRLGYLDEQDTIECRKDLTLHREVIPYQVVVEEETDDRYGTIHIKTNERPEEFKSLDEAHRRCAELNATLPPAVQLVYHAGQSYSIRTQTVQVTRKTEKRSPFTGELEDMEFTGQELAIFIADKITNPNLKDEQYEEFCFMEGNLRNKKTKVCEARQQKHRRSGYQPDPEAIPIDFSLQDLAEHFIIPEVPDVATNNPQLYNQYLGKLEEMETLCAL